ncbi:MULTISPECIES: hypothetical protein [Streptomyces]|uniref:hypothetical protein n=1 Tax=Streptomyces TaxID=1883 RepID=UPI003322F249
MAESPDRFENRCFNTNRSLQSCVGYFIDRITLNEGNADNKENTLDVWLREGPCKPDVVISLANLYSVRPIEPDVSGAFIDEIAITHLPTLPLPWSVDAVGRLARTKDVPALAWLRIIGPVEVDALAAIVTVYQAPSDDEVSVLR